MKFIGLVISPELSNKRLIVPNLPNIKMKDKAPTKGGIIVGINVAGIMSFLKGTLYL
jgi:hypothetical protein